MGSEPKRLDFNLGTGDSAFKLRVEKSAFEHGYAKQDIIRVLINPIGGRDNSPREGVRTLIGLDRKNNPITILQRMDDEVVYHAYRMESKHEKMLWSHPW